MTTVENPLNNPRSPDTKVNSQLILASDPSDVIASLSVFELADTPGPEITSKSKKKMIKT